MNVEQLRQSLKVKWLTYYRDNRKWLSRLGIWVTCDGQRRPSSSFILGTLAVLEPQLTQLLPLVVDLTSNPDRIVEALGLNLNPDEELKSAITQRLLNDSLKLLPSSDNSSINVTIAQSPAAKITAIDEACQGK